MELGENEQYISLQEDIVLEKVEENDKLHEFERHARHQLRKARRIEKELDRALEALTNGHSFEAEYLISQKQMHCIPFEYRVHMGNLLEIAVWELALRQTMHRQQCILYTKRPDNKPWISCSSMCNEGGGSGSLAQGQKVAGPRNRHRIRGQMNQNQNQNPLPVT